MHLYLESFLQQFTILKPQTHREALQLPEWQQAMRELQAFVDTHTRNVIPCLLGIRLVGNRWIYKVKYRPDGAAERRKARQE